MRAARKPGQKAGSRYHTRFIVNGIFHNPEIAVQGDSTRENANATVSLCYFRHLAGNES